MSKCCRRCNTLIEQGRLQVISDTEVCSRCAVIANVPKNKGYMSFDHKTGGVVQVVDPQEFAVYRKYQPYGRYTGMGSGVHAMSKPIVKLG